MGLFPPRPSPTANYDWIDLASATGYVLYDGFNAKDSAGNKYTLAESSHAFRLTGLNTLTSGVTSIISSVTGDGAQSFDEDFDLSPFQLPRTIEGNAYVRISIGIGGNEVSNTAITAKLRKVSGSEIEIATVLQFLKR